MPTNSTAITTLIANAEEALGHSIVYAEHRGDFALANKLVDQAVDQARMMTEPQLLAEALLMKAKVSLLQGKPQVAITYCQTAQQQASSDVHICLKSLAYETLATHGQFNRFPDGGAAAIELQDRWDGVAYFQQKGQLFHSLFAQATDPKIQFDAWMAYSFTGTRLAAKSTLKAQNTSNQLLVKSSLRASSPTINSLLQHAQRTGNESYVALAELSVSDVYHEIGDRQQAQTYLNKAQEHYQRLNDAIGLANTYLLQGDWATEGWCSPQVWNFALLDSCTEGSNQAWYVETQEFCIETNVESILALYNQAEALFEQATAPRGIAAIKIRKAYLQATENNYTAALASIGQATELFQSVGDELGYWLAQTQTILCQIGLGHFAQVNSIADTIGHWGATQGSFSYVLGLGILLNRAARFWLIAEGDYPRSLAVSKAAETLFTSLGADLNRIQAVVDQAKVNQAIGTTSIALPLYEQSLDELTTLISQRPKLVDNVRQRFILLACAVYQLYQKDMNSSGMQRCADRLQIQIDFMSKGGTAASIINTAGSLLSSLFSQEQDTFDEMTERFTNWGLGNLAESFIQNAQVQVPLYQGLDLREEGRTAEAQKYFDQALTAARSIGGNQQNFLEAVVYATCKDYDRAATAFAHFQKQGASSSGFIGPLISAMNTVDSGREAQQYQRRNHEQAFNFYTRIKKYDLALPHFQQLQQLGDGTWWENDDQYWLHLAECAEMHEGLNKLSAALNYYEQAMQILESQRSQLGQDEFKTALTNNSNARDLYFGAARTALQLATVAQQQQNAAEEQQALAIAFQYTEKGQGRALLDLMKGAASQSLAMGNALTNHWRELNARLSLRQGLLAQEHNHSSPDQKRIADLSQLIQRDRQILQEVEAKLSTEDPAFYRAINPTAEVATLDSITKKLPVGTALLQIYYVGDELIVWAITQSGIVQYQRQAISNLQINQWVRQVVTACAEYRSANEAVNQLAKLFLQPLADTINQVHRLYIVTYGATHSLPFHILPFNQQPLGHSHQISYLPSASVLQFVRSDQPLGQVSALVIGNPARMAHISERTGHTQVALPLKGAELEARYVASLAPDNTLLLNEEATEPAVRSVLNKHRIIHFATHGILDEEAPLLSSVLLADGEQLTVSELMGLHIQADLVVLSACNTARGKTTKGDDVLGLSRGLLAAGAKAVLVSLWPVNDIATTLLISEFFRQIYQAQATMVEALHEAQQYLRQLSTEQVKQERNRLSDSLKVSSHQPIPTERLAIKRDLRPKSTSKELALDSYDHPYYWAPFVLIG